MSKITLEYGSSNNLRRDVERLAVRWSRERPDCNGREFTIELGEYAGIETYNTILDAVLTVELCDVIDNRKLVAGEYVYVVDTSSFGEGVPSDEAEEFCTRFEAYCEEVCGDDVTISARQTHLGEAPGLYELRAGRSQILGHSIKVPEEIQDVIDQAYEYAMETWPAA